MRSSAPVLGTRYTTKALPVLGMHSQTFFSFHKLLLTLSKAAVVAALLLKDLLSSVSVRKIEFLFSLQFHYTPRL
jgi:hypothetical protein